jgi:putative sigma-54 modulation protein
MIIKINSVHFDATIKLDEFVRTKVNKLSQYYDDIISAEIFLRVEKPHNVENKISEIKLEVPGGSGLFAKKQANTFEEATDLAVEALRSQLIRHKEKIKKI